MTEIVDILRNIEKEILGKKGERYEYAGRALIGIFHKDGKTWLNRTYKDRKDYVDSVATSGLYVLSSQKEIEDYLLSLNAEIEFKQYFQELRETLHELIRDDKLKYEDFLQKDI